jgi:hypothetical protein
VSLHRIGTFLCAGGIGIGLSMAAAPSSADDAAQAQEQAVARLEQNRASYQSAQAKLAELEAAYTRGMTSRTLSGEPRAKLVQEIAEAKQRISAARGAHPELFEAARTSGVSWSVLDRYEELPAPRAARHPTLEDDPDDITVGSEDVDDIEGAESRDPDDLRATSRDPD